MADLWFFTAHDKRGARMAAVGPTWWRWTASWVPGERWRCGAVYLTAGYGGGRYVALVIGERMDDAPWSMALGPMQVVVSARRRDPA